MVPEIIHLNNIKLIQSAKLLVSRGKLAIFDNKFVYVQVSDDYVHQLFPLLEDEHIIKPDYFGEKLGAHITVIYPEEYKKLDEKDLGVEHSFLVKELIAARINQKIYYALWVESPSLQKIRKKYDLPDLLCFKGYQIGFHITIGAKV